jgi:endonuclease/exonuclease/phosphatase family metal-dependent hydrolase
MYAEPFRVIGIHCHWNDANIRAAEGSWLRDRIIEMLQDPDEPHDIILLGDLNGSPSSAPHPQLQEGNILHLLPKENGNVTHVNGTSQIDHCYVTQDATDKLPKKSAFVIRPEYYGETPSQFDETYSDHYPIFIDFRPDAHTDFVDFAMFAAHWLETGCNLQNNWCGSADFTGDGQVDRADLCKFAEWWLAGM